ncbi:putative mRNA cleavage factor complex II protein Clp1 [Aspergillus nomiae NRRL 13137]|uniref:Polynucleotide 5'-hydroxyl-kinase GRC3 n=1 Tax=Aspergillus nomiae NRRL (strain ATCC 15546 / NRRL 13137 / CBS 260.88 / M93) TaxID=1509407 RepID=A0A0L1JDE4_ASPN3|nr:putative mRNA cleavage factor complex II protein Clp1 [Aspergillus nomiae NRRL 13137]KNG89809.1 putative mRNA cleavage factor complex II protein Clp1 [Aspergillus nomiae NRRL 13137]
MSLPGLDLTQPTADNQFAPAPPSQISLSKGSEWRFEVAFGTVIRVKLLAGTAELFGTELAPSQTYTFSGTKGAIYTWHGCTLEVSAGDTGPSVDGLAPGGLGGATPRGLGAGGCQSEYTAEETPMVEYANVHFALETMRQEAKATGKDGPRVLILGPENAGKTSVAKILTAYATKVERQPIVVNLDPNEGMLSVPGTLTATAFRTMMDVEEGWGSSPMSGPSAVPVKLPLVYFYPMQNPLEAEGSVYRPIVSRLALSVMGRMAEDEEARETGIIVDTPGALSQGKPGSLEMINHIVTEFRVFTTILVIGSERLYSLMMKNYDNKPTSGASAVASDERITVVKLSKSGGCVDRDAAFMKGVRESQIRTYFFGNPIPSTASAALSLSASSTTNVTLSPHAQQLEFNTLSIYNYTIASLEEDEDEYDPSQLGAGDSFLPGGGNDAEVSQSQQEEPARATPLPGIVSSIESATPALASNIPLKKVLPPAPSTLANSLIAITNAPTTASVAEVRDASIMGFLYVAEVDSEKGKIRALAPVGGRVPPRAFVWGKKWPREVVGLVG